MALLSSNGVFTMRMNRFWQGSKSLSSVGRLGIARAIQTASFVLFGCMVLLATTQIVYAVEVRLKDVTTIEGVRGNTLQGTGLVIGLNNTGGKSPTTRQYIVNLLDRFGTRSDPRLRLLARNDTQLKTNNVSAVMVTADLPVYKRPGQRIDVNVGTLDDAKSLLGGILLMTPLMGADGEVYATADGSLKVGGFSASGQAGSVTKNHPTTGLVPDGGMVEKQVLHEFGLCRQVCLLLEDADFVTAQRISDIINTSFEGVAHARDKGTVALVVPDRYRGRVSEFLSVVESLPVMPDSEARVVINERTGTVVVGENVKLSMAAITHANLSVVTGESPQVSQPAPFSNGETVVVPRTEIAVEEENDNLKVLRESATVGDLVSALNSLGASPRDLATIFQMLKAAGALHARLELQ